MTRQLSFFFLAALCPGNRWANTAALVDPRGPGRPRQRKGLVESLVIRERSIDAAGCRESSQFAGLSLSLSPPPPPNTAALVDLQDSRPGHCGEASRRRQHTNTKALCHPPPPPRS